MKSVVGPLVAASCSPWPAGRSGSPAKRRSGSPTSTSSSRRCATPRRKAKASGRGVAGLERRCLVSPRRPKPTCARRAPTAGYWRADYAAIARGATPTAWSPRPIPRSCCSPRTRRSARARRDRSGDIVRRLDNVVKSYGEVLKSRGRRLQRQRAGVRVAGDGRGLQLRIRDPRARDAGPRPRADAGKKPRRGRRRTAETKWTYRRDRRCMDVRAAAAGDRDESIQDRHPQARGGTKGRP